MKPRPVRAMPESVSDHRSRSDAETAKLVGPSASLDGAMIATLLTQARVDERGRAAFSTVSGSSIFAPSRVADVEHVDDPLARASRPWRPARRGRDRRTSTASRYSKPDLVVGVHLDDRVGRGLVELDVDVRPGPRSRRSARVVARGDRRPAARRRASPSSASRSMRSTALAAVVDPAERIGGAEHVEREAVGRAEQVRFDHVETADRERAGERREQAGSVAARRP